jgi:uncharacterized protein YdhG (YjbR/CyaY superfamily)
MPRPLAKDIDDYIADFPPDVQKKLNQVRSIIRKSAPNAVEAIKYAIPAFVQDGNLIFFAGFKNHIGIYPAPVEAPEFKKDFARYKLGKGTVQLPLTEPIPVELIKRIVAYRIKKTLEALELKKTKKKDKKPVKSNK